ncbi:MAG: cobalt transporter [Bradyrhizobiaceae bacterium]|nr:MAG: cobalt transporter [Bradyrhizobiaceae bacterium]
MPDTAGPGTAVAMVPGLIWAFRIHEDGRSEPLDVEQPVDLRHDGLLWLHFNLADARARQWLSATELDLPPVAKTLFLSHDNFQQMHSADDSVYGVIADLVRAIDRPTEETGFLRFVMTEKLLVSGRVHALCSVDATRRVLESGQRVSSAAGLLETIVEYVAETMERIADRIEQELDAFEERVLSDDTVDLRKDLGKLRRTCVRLHRQLSGLRFTFHRLEQQDSGALKPALRLRAGKLAQRLDSLDHAVVEMRERSRLLQEELQLKMEEQSNKSLHLLSVLTALLLPPTLITGIFGMNTKDLPLTDVDGGFVWAAGMIVVSSALAYFIMKRLGIVR